MTDHVEPLESEELHSHPGPRAYVGVAVVLAIITALEVAIYYVEPVKNSGLFVPFLIGFAVVKFVLVALWFMHLRFDNNIFKRFFITGIILALGVFGVVLWWFVSHEGAAPNVGA